MTRKIANQQIVRKIQEIIEKYPGLRFHQILQNIGISIPNTDQFYEESEVTLKRISENENQRTS